MGLSGKGTINLLVLSVGGTTMNNLRFFSRVGILIGLILVLVSCTQAASPQTSTTPTVDGARLTASARPSPNEIPPPTPLTASAANVGRAPTACPLDPP